MVNLMLSFAAALAVQDTSRSVVTGSPLPARLEVALALTSPSPILLVADGAVEGDGGLVVIAGLVALADADIGDLLGSTTLRLSLHPCTGVGDSTKIR